MGILEGDWNYCARCGFPNDLENGCCSECGLEFEDSIAEDADATVDNSTES